MSTLPAWAGNAALIFLSLFVQGVPFLLAGSLLGGFLTVFGPVAALTARWPRSKVAAAGLGAGLALLFPACDCAVVPVVRRLLQRGLPLPAGLAYLLAAPVLNPICLVSTWLAYQNKHAGFMVLARAGGSFVLAMAGALVLAQVPAARLLVGEALLPGASGGEEDAGVLRVNPALPAWLQKPAAALAVALNDFWNVSLLYLAGSVATSLFAAFFPPGLVAGAGPWILPAALGMAFALSLCSAADAFIVNAFTGLPVAVQLAFLWLGPIYNLRMVVVYRSLLQFRAIAGLGAVIVLLIFLLFRAILITA